MEQTFTAQQASRLTNCTHHQLRYWDRVNLVKPSVQATGGRPGVRRLYSFRDLVALRVVRSLIDNGLSLQRIRRAWDYLRREAGMDGELSAVRLITDGVSVFSLNGADHEVMDALRNGQMAFYDVINEITQSVEEDVTGFELDKTRFLEMIRRVEEDVTEETRAVEN